MLTSQLGELKHTQLSRHLRSALLLVTGLNSVCVWTKVDSQEIWFIIQRLDRNCRPMQDELEQAILGTSCVQ